VIVHAPAAVIAERLPAAVGPVEAIDDRTCAIDSGAESVETLALVLGMLGAGFEPTGCPELVEHPRLLGAR
jgi:hypothetical protein